MEWYEILIRLGGALLIGLIIGFEREHHQRPAGMKTHIMVCMGAAVVSMIQIQMQRDALEMIAADPALADSVKVDVGRLGAQVISGIGFLGAGTIIVRQGSIKGLTTAATLWLTACLGLAVGMGYYMLSACGFVVVMIVLVLLRFFQTKSFKAHTLNVEIILSDKRQGVDSVKAFCSARGIIINSLQFTSGSKASDTEFHSIYALQVPHKIEKRAMLMELVREPYILQATEQTE